MTIRFSPAVKTSVAWPLAKAQARLDAALRQCGKPGIVVDNVLGRQTADGIETLRKCPGYDTTDAASEARALTPALWAKLLPGVAFPSVADRARTLTFNYEGTDYNQFLWNVGQPADPYAFGTWGPFGATLAQGGEIQKILRAVAAQPGGRALIDQAFVNASSGETPTYSWRDRFCTATPTTPPNPGGSALLMGLNAPLSDGDKAALKGEFCSDNRYLMWPRAFAKLGVEPSIIAAYDALYAENNRKIAARLAQIYTTLTLVPTEIDWAFFLDRGTQFTTDLARAESAIRALPGSASPAERRLAISRSSRPTNASQRKLRVGRDMAFTVSAAASLDQEERDTWTYVGKLSAEQLGLNDNATPAKNPFDERQA